MRKCSAKLLKSVTSTRIDCSWNYEQVDFEFKLSVRSKLELNALKLCKSTSSGFAMYRLMSI